MTIYNALRLFAQAAFFPQHCVLCEKWVLHPDWRPLCDSCLSNLESFTVPICYRCGAILPANIDDRFASCAKCRDRAYLFDVARATGPYQGGLRDVIRRYKFDGFRRLAFPLGRRLADTFRSADLDFRPDWIVPVPLHPARRRERGFDQTLLLSRALASQLGAPVFRGVLRVRNTKAQFGLDFEERRKNLKDAFRLLSQEWKSGTGSGTRLLIVDDVMTTGTTVDEISGLFRREMQDVRIMALTVARAQLTGDWI